MPRHAEDHNYPPHKINYRANIYALKKIGVKQIIAVNTVGSMQENVKPGELLIPNDFIDFTKNRPTTFYDDKTVHIDMTDPYCPNIREVLINNGEVDVIDKGIYVCTEGPRFETPAEIRMFKKLGGTVVGMTGVPEVILARELEMCYASICVVSNYAASISKKKLTIDEVFEVLENKKQKLIKIIKKTIKKLKYDPNCKCQKALEGAKI